MKIKTNKKKTKIIMLLKRRPQLSDGIVCQGVLIPRSEQVKYLGLTLDKKLNFKTHINSMCRPNIGIAALCRLFPLLSRKSALSVKNKLLIFKMIVRPAFT